MPDDTASAHTFYTGPLPWVCAWERQVAVRGDQVSGMRPFPRFPTSKFIAMPRDISRHRLWARIAASVLALLVVVATHDPRPDLTRATINVIQWSLQTQSVR